MARTPKPWWREDRQAWFVTIGGTRYNPDRDEDAADRDYHRLLSLSPEARAPKTSESRGLTVAEVFDQYLDWVQKHRAPRTYDWYLDHIQSFIDFLTKPAEMPIADLEPYQVVQ